MKKGINRIQELSDRIAEAEGILETAYRPESSRKETMEAIAKVLDLIQTYDLDEHDAYSDYLEKSAEPKDATPRKCNYYLAEGVPELETLIDAWEKAWADGTPRGLNDLSLKQCFYQLIGYAAARAWRRKERAKGS